MQSEQFLKKFFSATGSLVRYNIKIIFTGKFIYFVMAAVSIFLIVTVFNLMDAEARPSEATVFTLLLVPGILITFYPIAFGIQNDIDNRMIEILFGIPDYRYKVWLLRLLLIFLGSFFILFILSLLWNLCGNGDYRHSILDRQTRLSGRPQEAGYFPQPIFSTG